MLKEKNKPGAPARARGPRARKGRPSEAEEAADPELPAAALESCRGLLRSILTHWEPEAPGADPEREDAGPVGAIASLVASWVLRSAAGSPLGRADAAGLLGWLESHILPRPAVVAELLRDGAVTSGLFRLYSRFCGAAEPEGPEDRLAGLFNAVLLRLVAARGPVGSPLQPVLEAVHLSSLDAEEDADTRGNVGGWARRLQTAWGGLGAGSTPRSHSLRALPVKPWGRTALSTGLGSTESQPLGPKCAGEREALPLPSGGTLIDGETAERNALRTALCPPGDAAWLSNFLLSFTQS